MRPCSICSDPYPLSRVCDQSHPGVCHPCAVLNLAGNTLLVAPHVPPVPHALPQPGYAAQLAAYTAAMEAYHQRFTRELHGTLVQLLAAEEDPLGT